MLKARAFLPGLLIYEPTNNFTSATQPCQSYDWERKVCYRSDSACQSYDWERFAT